MREGARWQAALEVLDRIEAGNRAPDRVLAQDLKSRRYAGSKDRRAITALVFDALRARARLGWWCERLGLPVTWRSRLLALGRWRGLEMPSLAEPPHGLATLAPNETEALANWPEVEPDLPQDVRFEVPAFLLPCLKERFGPDIEAELAALNQPASVDIRVNGLRTTRQDLQQNLAALGIETSPLEQTEQGLRVIGQHRLDRLPAFRDGLFEVQDESSQRAVDLVDAKPGMTLLDACAGAGGKTLALAAAIGGRGTLVAADADQARLSRLQPRLDRAGLPPGLNLETRVLAPMIAPQLAQDSDPWIAAHSGAFDRVLCDLPCSGSGTWRRNPHARWRLTEQGLADLLVLQDEILARMAPLTKPGGRLILATCSVLPEEGIRLSERFSERQGDFQAIGEPLLLTPYRDGCDGFFAAAFERKSN
ncbi:MAG: RsmB/NOP family class I SAM-dependent RNA methyltransferase [Magnetovibrionaceae bacterium]